MSFSSVVPAFIKKSFCLFRLSFLLLSKSLFVFFVCRSCFYQKVFLSFSSDFSALIAESCYQPDNENVT